MKTLFLFSIFMLATTSAHAAKIERVVGYSYSQDGQGYMIQSIEHPDAPKGYKIVVVNPDFDLKDAQKNLSKKVELHLVKEAVVDSCNQHSFSGRMEKKVVPGNEFLEYFELSVGGLTSTKMACISNTENVHRPVTIDTDLGLLELRHEIVLYVPEDVSVEFRQWKPGDFKQTK